MKKTLSLILSLLLLFTVACADTVYDLGGDFWIALPDNTTTYSNWYYVDNVMFFFNVNDLADFGYQQQWLDSLKDSALETLAVIIFGTNDGYQTEEIAAGIPCASFRYTEQGYEYRFVLALNGTKLLTAAMTDSTTGKYPDEAACRSIMNALFIYAQEDTQINV